MMKVFGFIGRLIYSVPLLLFGFGHLGNANAMKGMVPDILPAPVFWVYFTGVALVLAGIAIIINKKVRLASILLGIMLLSFAFLVHLPGLLAGDMQNAFPMFMKDTALAGAAFYISAHAKS